MNHKLTAFSALAVILASLSLFSVLHGLGWLIAGIGAVIIIALAATLTRLEPVRAAIAATVLALAGSFPLLSAQSWGLKVAGLAIIAVTAASFIRLKVLPLLAGAVTYLAALLIYLDTVFAGGHALAGLIPTGSSLHHVWQVANQGLAMRASPPPVSSTPGVALLAAAGLGGVAIVTDLIAVRLRSPAIAGLPLLVLFSVPITTSAKPGGLGSSVTFCLAVIGFLALLSADGRDRLRIWGRLVSVWYGARPDEQSKGPDTRGLAAAGRRIGATAVCVALVVPLLIPGLRLHGLFAKHDLPGNGGEVGLPAAIDQMHRQLTSATADHQVVLTYTTTKASPAEQYLPLAVTNYDPRSQDFAVVPPGASTKISRLLAPVPGQDATIPESISRTKITMSKSVTGYTGGLTFLPAPYAPVAVSIPASSDPAAWQADNATLTIWSSAAKLAGLSYQVTSNEAEPTRAELNIPQQGLPPGLTQYLSYDGPDQSQLTGIAKSITRAAKTAYQKAQAMATWFSSSGGFSYSLQPPWLAASGGLLSNTQQLLDFLTKDKIGYCQQFAYAMAILSRLLGIPSRIAVGYTAGILTGHNTWQVTEADAHAWPELYFKDVGWTRFEPTPSGTAGQRTATQPDYSTIGPAGSQKPGGQGKLPGQAGGPIGRGGGKNSVKRIPNPGLDGGSVLPLAHHGSVPILPIVVIVLILAAIAPGITRLVVRRGRWQRASGDVALASAAWYELRDDLHDFGLECRASESPRAIARRVGSAESLEPDVRAALDRVARAHERACYSTRPEASGTLRSDVANVRRALSRQASPAVRWRAWLLPPSTLEPVRAGLQHSLDLFGWLDAAARQIRRRVGREAPYQQGA